jgi:hypothetical protein
VEVYHSWKGARALTYWYALVPDHQAEGGGRDFDIRALPAKYTRELLIESKAGAAGAESFGKTYDDLLEAHKTAMRHAIDDGYDLLTRRRRRGLWQRLRRLLPS